MFRKRPAITLSTLVLSVAALFANSQGGLAQRQTQSAPNLSGTWELVEDNNDAKNLKPTDAGFPRLTLVISQEGSLIRITQKQIRRGTETVQEYSYYTDGRSETNLGRVELWPLYVAKLESVSGWQDERLLIKYSPEHLRWFGRGVSDSWDTRKDEWRLGPYGSTLILRISTAREGQVGLQKRKLTFRKM